MSPEPEKAAASPKSQAAASPAPAPEPIFTGKTDKKSPPPSGPGEPYIPLPDLSRPVRRRWLYALAALLLTLAASVGILFMHDRSAAPAAQPAATEAPAVPGPQYGN